LLFRRRGNGIVREAKGGLITMALRHFAAQAATALRVRCAPSVHPRFSVSLARLMSTVQENLKYAKSHEWVRVEGDVAYVGITDHAQAQLGDIVFVDVQAGQDELVTKGSPFAVVESVKSASDVYAPVSGTVIEVNGALSDSPETVNQSAFGDGWFAKIKLSDPSELDTMLDAKAYEAHIQEH
jgi:glycine cleavage system H protein